MKSPTGWLPERHGRDAGQPDADRRGILRSLTHRVRHRGRREPLEPPRMGPRDGRRDLPGRRRCGLVQRRRAGRLRVVQRVRAGGEVADRIELDRPCYACMLGGGDGRTLFMVVARWFGPDKIDELMQAKTGQILTTRGRRPARRLAVRSVAPPIGRGPVRWTVGFLRSMRLCSPKLGGSVCATTACVRSGSRCPGRRLDRRTLSPKPSSRAPCQHAGGLVGCRGGDLAKSTTSRHVSTRLRARPVANHRRNTASFPQRAARPADARGGQGRDRRLPHGRTTRRAGPGSRAGGASSVVDRGNRRDQMWSASQSLEGSRSAAQVATNVRQRSSVVVGPSVVTISLNLSTRRPERRARGVPCCRSSAAGCSRRSLLRQRCPRARSCRSRVAGSAGERPRRRVAWRAQPCGHGGRDAGL